MDEFEIFLSAHALLYTKQEHYEDGAKRLLATERLIFSLLPAPLLSPLFYPIVSYPIPSHSSFRSIMNHQHYSEIFTASSATPSSSDDIIIVSPGFETLSLIDSIYACPLEGIGSSKFMKTYCVNLERLSIQAHLTAGIISASQSNVVGTTNSIASPGMGEVFASLGGGAYEEYIVEALLENTNKLENLVKTLLALEYWRDNVLFRKDKGSTVENEEDDVDFEIEGGERDRDELYAKLNDVDGGLSDDDDTGVSKGLASLLAENSNSLRAAFILHVETTIVSLLNLVFYKGIPPAFLEGDGDQFLLSLVDYCGRQLVFLGTPEGSNPSLRRQKSPLSCPDLSKYLETRSRMDEIQDSVYDESYKTAVAAVSLSRYLCENVEELPVSIVSRMLEVHDFPILMVPLIEEPPWTRRRQVEQRRDDRTISKIIWEKLNDTHEWSEVLPKDLLMLTKVEGQPWLALFHLTASKVCRESYGLDEFRKAQLMRLRRYIHETLMDQLPVLPEVARFLDELSILGVPAAGRGVHRPSSNASSSGLLLQRVDSLRESVIGHKSIRDDDHLDGIIQSQWDKVFSLVTDSTDEDLQSIAVHVYGGPGSDHDEEDSQKIKDSSPFLQAPTSEMSVDKVTLHLEEQEGSVMTFELRLVDETEKIVDTKIGSKFRRIKLSILQLSGEGAAINPRAQASAVIHFSRQSNETIQPTPICLPTIESKSSPDSYDELGIVLPENFSSKEWRQIGSKFMLQLGFARIASGIVPAGCTNLRGYELKVAYLSLPIEAECSRRNP